MRSWSTLQPGEVFACTGCHESKNTAPPVQGYVARKSLPIEPERLDLHAHSARGFSFLKQVQPILDRHCIGCHFDRKPIEALVNGQAWAKQPVLAGGGTEPRAKAGPGRGKEFAFSLLGMLNLDQTAKRYWSDSYLALTRASRSGGEAEGPFSGDCTGKLVNSIGSQSVPEPLPPFFAGAARSGLMTLLESGHKGVNLSREELRTMAENGDEAVRRCGLLHPDVILMDLMMPGTDGVTASRLIHEKYPTVHVIALTSFPEDDLVQKALQAGATGYLMKNVSARELAEAIRAAHKGKMTLSPEAAQALAHAAALPFGVLATIS